MAEKKIKGGFELKPGTGWATAWAAAPAALAGFQAAAAQRQLGEVRTDIDNYRRQDIENPFANLSNPYENLAVATQAAEIKMEQTDQALANTLDTLRETGAAAGGATAIANAALKSKQGVAASIEQQEVNNQKLQAQGQLQVDIAKGKGETIRMEAQELRDINELNRLQSQSDMAQYTRDSAMQTGMKALGAAAGVRNAGIVLEQKDKKDKGVASAADTNTNNMGPVNYDYGDPDPTSTTVQASQLNKPGATNLSQFYGAGKLPSVAERSSIYTSIPGVSGDDYTGTEDQNIELLKYLQGADLTALGNNNNNNRYGLKEGGYDELNIGGSGSLLASNEYTPGSGNDEADNYYNAYKTWHEETYPGQPVTYAGEGEGKIKSFNKALGYKN